MYASGMDFFFVYYCVLFIYWCTLVNFLLFDVELYRSSHDSLSFRSDGLVELTIFQTDTTSG